MNQQKLWRIAFMMLAAFSLASCKPSARQTRGARQIRLRAWTGIPYRQRTFQIQTEQSLKRLLLFYNRISVPLSGLFVYLSLFLILALMLLTDTRFTSRMVAMASSSKWRSSCMMRKIYCAVERPLYLCSHACQRFGRSWAK